MSDLHRRLGRSAAQAYEEFDAGDWAMLGENLVDAVQRDGLVVIDTRDEATVERFAQIWFESHGPTHSWANDTDEIARQHWRESARQTLAALAKGDDDAG